MMAFTVAFLSPAFYYLPRATLAAIIISAIINLINFSDIRKTWRYSRWETAPFVVTLIGVLTIGIGVGIGLGILTSIALHLYRTSRPHIAILGRIGNTNQYENINDYEEARLMPHTTIVRMDESLYFANMQHLEDHLRTFIAKYPNTNSLVLALSSANRIDASALQLLTDIVSEFDELGITIYFAEVKSHLRNRLNYYNFIEIIGADRFYETIHDAVRKAENEPDLKIEEYHI
ncbi:STAS domain-containing protein [bacterium]|nr:STAS domain-containing protein [bacterium]